MNFTPDIRNIGGRKAITDIMSNHYQKMDNIRPILNTRESPKEISKTIKFPSVIEKLTNHVRIHIATSSSTTKRRRLSKLNQTKMVDHYNNIKHMQRRIRDIGSVRTIQLNERKKNRFDPISNPVLFFRDDGNNSPVLTTNYVRKLLQPPKTSSVYDHINTLHSKRLNTPVASLHDSNPLVVLKNEIMKEIVNKRIYKDDELKELFNKTRKANSHLGQNTVEKAISQIMQKLDS